MGNYLFTSESVTAGHPDKVADQISDAILDAYLEKDKNARVACEVLVTTNQVVVAGEITSEADVDVEGVIRNVVKNIGYTHYDYGFDTSCRILNFIDRQSPDIALGVDAGGAGDQGMCFGAACTETPSLMPLPLMIARSLTNRHNQLLHTKDFEWLRPDGKSQATVIYNKNKEPIGIDTVVMSVHHDPSISINRLRSIVEGEIIKPILKDFGLGDSKLKILINPTGRFVIGGPMGDTGLTGRKIEVDTYGGYFRNGGGSLSSKDPTKVDRTGAYMARYIAKNIVASGIADVCEVQLAYVIGVKDPVSVFIDYLGTERVDTINVKNVVQKLFPLSVNGMINKFDMQNFKYYSDLAAFGHFGWDDLPWEQTDMVDLLKEEIVNGK